MNQHIRRSVALWALSSSTVVAACGGASSGSGAEAPEPTVVTGSGTIAATVDDYRALLGADNGDGPGPFTSGRREINWDGVPDEFAAPNALPPDFFNDSTAPRARGAVLETPGDHVAVSADAENPSAAAVRFGDINPTYPDVFETFSDERLFSPVGSNVVDLRFVVPGTTTPGAVRGFGAVYTDVDRENTAEFELFDREDRSLGTYAVPESQGGLSFLGIAFAEPLVARARIVYGNTKLGPDDDDRYDVAVMDDFIYGEPQVLDT